ncbi:hypothetical protein ANCDUO_13480, partial [Ancylostoma duodenale]
MGTLNYSRISERWLTSMELSTVVQRTPKNELISFLKSTLSVAQC